MYVVCGGEGTIHNSILNARVRSINARVRFYAFPRIYRSWIKLNDAQLRMLFLTGDGKEKGGRSPNGMQLAAIKRATNRFNDMKRRGLLDGNEHNFYVTLYGKEYYKDATVNK